MDDSFVKAPINIPKLSGFDKSHQNLLTSKCGTITPILIDELIPGSKVNLKLALSAQLPPLASDTYMRCSIKCEAFFIPFRLLCASFESWFTDNAKRFSNYTAANGASITPTSTKGFLPCIGNFDTSIAEDNSAIGAMVASGSLFDYLGFRSGSNSWFSSAQGIVSAMPSLAYQRVYHDWYRNSLVQQEVFLPPTGSYSVNPSPAANATFAGCAACRILRIL